VVLWPFLSCGFSTKYIHSFIHSLSREFRGSVDLCKTVNVEAAATGSCILTVTVGDSERLGEHFTVQL